MTPDQPFDWNKGKCPFCREYFADVQKHIARSPRCKAMSDAHDRWCPYRKRLDLSFVLGELSGALKTDGGR